MAAKRGNAAKGRRDGGPVDDRAPLSAFLLYDADDQTIDANAADGGVNVAPLRDAAWTSFDDDETSAGAARPLPAPPNLSVLKQIKNFLNDPDDVVAEFPYPADENKAPRKDDRAGDAARPRAPFRVEYPFYDSEPAEPAHSGAPLPDDEPDCADAPAFADDVAAPADAPRGDNRRDDELKDDRGADVLSLDVPARLADASLDVDYAVDPKALRDDDHTPAVNAANDNDAANAGDRPAPLLLDAWEIVDAPAEPFVVARPDDDEPRNDPRIRGNDDPESALAESALEHAADKLAPADEAPVPHAADDLVGNANEPESELVPVADEETADEHAPELYHGTTVEAYAQGPDASDDPTSLLTADDDGLLCACALDAPLTTADTLDDDDDRRRCSLRNHAGGDCPVDLNHAADRADHADPESAGHADAQDAADEHADHGERRLSLRIVDANDAPPLPRRNEKPGRAPIFRRFVDLVARRAARGDLEQSAPLDNPRDDAEIPSAKPADDFDAGRPILLVPNLDPVSVEIAASFTC